MIEAIIALLLALIAYKIYLKKSKNNVYENFYSAEEKYSSSRNLVNFKSDLYLYFIAEFSELTQATHLGVVKKLGFSDFIFIYDKSLKKFITPRVKIIGTNGYTRSSKVGFYKYLSIDKDWMELNIHLSLSDYDAFVNEIKEAAAERESFDKKLYFLYSINGYQSFEMDKNNVIYYIDSILKVEKYNSYYADKIGVMVDLRSNLNQLDQEQEIFKQQLIDRFNEVNS